MGSGSSNEIGSGPRMASRRLRVLYREIHECDRCLTDPRCEMQPDEERVRRRVVTRAATSRLFIVGQALGPNTQRRSGMPYMFPNEELSPTGRVLDQFVRRLGFTIDPSSTLPYAYSSDIVQRYPGRAAGGGGDRRPTSREVANCSEWLDTELRIVRPRVVLLLGKPAARYFLRAHGQDGRVDWGEVRHIDVGDARATAFVVYHPAYRRKKPVTVDALYATVARKARRLLRQEQSRGRPS
jgi:uracil-DNA glycosylase family 4